jgi:hypothetical protein
MNTDRKVRVIHGANECFFDLAGWRVSTVRASLVDAFNISSEAISLVNGQQVAPNYVLQSNETLEFIKQRGEKSMLDADERAQLNRIESMLNQLFIKPADHGSPGRNTETLEIATFINQLRKQRLNWKEILKACRERWPNDDHVRNAEQIRATYRRFFRPSSKRSD